MQGKKNRRASTWKHLTLDLTEYLECEDVQFFIIFHIQCVEQASLSI